MGLFFANVIEGRANSDLYHLSQYLSDQGVSHEFYFKKVPEQGKYAPPDNFHGVFNPGVLLSLLFPKAFFELAQHFRQYKPDVVLVSSDVLIGLGYLIRIVFRIPLIVYVRESNEESWIRPDRVLPRRMLGWAGIWSRDRIMERSCAVVCVSSAMARYIQSRAPRSKCDVLPIGVDLEAFLPIQQLESLEDTNHPLVVLYSGSLSENRSLTKLLDAIQIVDNAMPGKFHLKVAGHGLPKSRVGLEAAKRRIGDRVEVLPWLTRSEISREIASADFCVETFRQQFPDTIMTNIKILEYMAAGRVVVALADYDRVRMLSGNRGILYYEDTKEEIARALIKAARLSSQERTEVGESARLWVSAHHDGRKSAEKMYRVLIQCIESANLSKTDR